MTATQSLAASVVLYYILSTLEAFITAITLGIHHMGVTSSKNSPDQKSQFVNVY
jgi:hypothetical protein